MDSLGNSLGNPGGLWRDPGASWGNPGGPKGFRGDSEGVQAPKYRCHHGLGAKVRFPPEPGKPAKVVAASAAQSLPSTRAGGQDDGS